MFYALKTNEKRSENIGAFFCAFLKTENEGRSQKKRNLK